MFLDRSLGEGEPPGDLQGVEAIGEHAEHIGLAQLVWTDIDSLDLGTDLPCMPAELGTAFRAAGTVDRDALQPGRSDREIFMRTACALAGLSCSLDDIRGIPLIAAPFG